jgi:RimJ/RimL family protein N-acetyltransferase
MVSMKRIVEGEAAARWIAERLGKAFVPPYTAIAVERDGEMLGTVLFNNFTGPDIEISVAGSPQAWTPAFMHRLAHYVWIENGCLRASMTTESTKVGTLARRMGARLEGIKRNAFGPGRDGYCYGLLRDEWRFKS